VKYRITLKPKAEKDLKSMSFSNVLPYEEFLMLQEALEDFEDIKTLRSEKAEAALEPGKSLDAILQEIGS